VDLGENRDSPVESKASKGARIGQAQAAQLTMEAIRGRVREVLTIAEQRGLLADRRLRRMRISLLRKELSADWRPNGSDVQKSSRAMCLKTWRRGPGSNRRIKVLQTSPLPLGYRALAGMPFVRVRPTLNPAQPSSGATDTDWSGRRDLNSRPSPWQGDALPLSYSR
jgi:hypothetical protein